jgi:ribonuclease P protein component
VSGTQFWVYVKPNALDCSRLGMVVAKRVEPKAVRRNQAKRLIRECFRTGQPSLGANDFVVQLRVPLDSRAAKSAAREELNRLFEKAKACRG